jgi:DNA-binding MarR family transcriptional regulator
MDTSVNLLADRLRRIINRLIFLEKRSVVQLGGLRLHPSEIHLMQVIQEEPDLNAGEMAHKLGVTNGAVSQTLARLVRKGVVAKSKDSNRKNRVTASCTPTGETALRRFQEERATSLHALASYLDGLSEADRAVIQGFLMHMEEFLTDLE